MTCIWISGTAWYIRSDQSSILRLNLGLLLWPRNHHFSWKAHSLRIWKNQENQDWTYKACWWWYLTVWAEGIADQEFVPPGQTVFSITGRGICNIWVSKSTKISIMVVEPELVDLQEQCTSTHCFVSASIFVCHNHDCGPTCFLLAWCGHWWFLLSEIEIGDHLLCHSKISFLALLPALAGDCFVTITSTKER